jgi:hypothetical protein
MEIVRIMVQTYSMQKIHKALLNHVWAKWHALVIPTRQGSTNRRISIQTIPDIKL